MKKYEKQTVNTRKSQLPHIKALKYSLFAGFAFSLIPLSEGLLSMAISTIIGTFSIFFIPLWLAFYIQQNGFINSLNKVVSATNTRTKYDKDYNTRDESKVLEESQVESTISKDKKQISNIKIDHPVHTEAVKSEIVKTKESKVNTPRQKARAFFKSAFIKVLIISPLLLLSGQVPLLVGMPMALIFLTLIVWLYYYIKESNSIKAIKKKAEEEIADILNKKHKSKDIKKSADKILLKKRTNNMINKNHITIFIIIAVIAAVYLKNPENRFKMQTLLSFKECKITDSSIRKVTSDDITCKNYDIYYAEYNLEYFTKYSDEMTDNYNDCVNRWAPLTISIGDINSMTAWYDHCKKGNRISDASKKAKESAQYFAKNKCSNEVETDNKLLLSGDTNCNVDEKFDFIILKNQLNNNEFIAKGSIEVSNGTFKKIIHIGERVYNAEYYDVLFK